MPHFGNNFAIEASQVIYAGGAITSRIAIAKLQQQLAELDKEKNRQDIRFLLVGITWRCINCRIRLKCTGRI